MDADTQKLPDDLHAQLQAANVELAGLKFKNMSNQKREQTTKQLHEEIRGFHTRLATIAGKGY